MTHGSHPVTPAASRIVIHGDTQYPQAGPAWSPSPSPPVGPEAGPDPRLLRAARPSSPPRAAGSGNTPGGPRLAKAPPRMPRGAKRGGDRGARDPELRGGNIQLWRPARATQLFHPTPEPPAPEGFAPLPSGRTTFPRGPPGPPLLRTALQAEGASVGGHLGRSRALK